MALTPLVIADKSALARLGHPAVAERLGPLLTEGLVATCPIIDLEMLYSARSASDYDAMADERRALRSYPITPEVTDRALEVQHELAGRGHHRLAIPDLLIAAVAELNDLRVVHYDSDYDRIAAVTHQPTEWIARRGSL
ncbi:MAG: PIN domain nuclease [Actinomycetota bacterium]|nr:PIN domain nuclease [Actinomycetota bacterium]